MSDEALEAFATWCRLNSWEHVYDPVIRRRVFDAYASLKP